MINYRLIRAVKLRTLSLVVAAVLGASVLLVATVAAGPLEDDLILKALRNDYSGVKNLLDQGANVNTKSPGGYTPLSKAVSSFDPNPKVVQLLIDRGADVNAKFDDGSTALHLAIYSSNAEIVQILIKSGADVNAKNNDGTTAYFIAKTGNKLNNQFAEIVRILEASGAKQVKEADEERVAETAAKPAPKAKPAPRRRQLKGRDTPPPELPAGGALSGN